MNTENQDHEGISIVAFILGCCSVATWLLPILGVPVALIGIALGFVASKHTRAVIGLFLCTLSLAAAGVNAYVGYQKGITAVNAVYNDGR